MREVRAMECLEPGVILQPPDFIHLFSMRNTRNDYRITENTVLAPLNLDYIEKKNALLVKENAPSCKKIEKKNKSKKYNRGHWTKEEHALFLEGLKVYNRQWKKIAEHFVTTRTRRQIACHGIKYFKKLANEKKFTFYTYDDGKFSKDTI